MTSVNRANNFSYSLVASLWILSCEPLQLYADGLRYEKFCFVPVHVLLKNSVKYQLDKLFPFRNLLEVYVIL